MNLTQIPVNSCIQAILVEGCRRIVIIIVRNESGLASPSTFNLEPPSLINYRSLLPII